MADRDMTATEAVLASGLDPIILPRMLRHRAAVLDAGIPFRLISGRRGTDHQELLRKRYDDRMAEWISGGRVGPEPRPAAKPGTSKHELGFAYDYTGPRNSAEWVKSGELAEALGLESGHRYNDAGHIEDPNPIDTLRRLLRVRLASQLAGLGLAWVVLHE